MKMLPAVVLIISYFEIKAMWIKGLKKEIVVFLFFSILTLTYGYYYLLNKDTASLVRNIFDLVGFSY